MQSGVEARNATIVQQRACILLALCDVFTKDRKEELLNLLDAE
jgi:hypothetical protein